MPELTEGTAVTVLSEEVDDGDCVDGECGDDRARTIQCRGVVTSTTPVEVYGDDLNSGFPRVGYDVRCDNGTVLTVASSRLTETYGAPRGRGHAIGSSASSLLQGTEGRPGREATLPELVPFVVLYIFSKLPEAQSNHYASLGTPAYGDYPIEVYDMAAVGWSYAGCARTGTAALPQRPMI